MNGEAFHYATLSFENAAVFDARVHRVGRYPPVDEFVREIRDWFKGVADEEDDHQLASVRARMARFRGSVLFGILPFDHQALQLEQQLGDLIAAAEYFPSLVHVTQRLETLVDFLISNPENPKRATVISLLEDVAGGSSSGAVALVSPRSRLLVPGWGEELRSDLATVESEIDVIASRKRYLNGRYRRVILPWGGKGCPFLYELFHSFCSPSIDIVAYSSERSIQPRLRSLPKGSWNPTSRSPKIQSSEIEIVESVGDPDWKKIEFWTALRSVTEQSASGQRENDREFLLLARLVLLGNETKVFLKEGSKVIEVSDLVEGGRDAAEVKSRFPRKPVRELRPGDLIVLRTGGSGDYLISVADALMKKDGNADLRERALDWKDALHAALVKHGSEVITDLLKEKGHGFESHHRYIWTWTTMDVIRPRSENQFFELLAILQDFGFLESEALETAESRWAMMREIIHYHRIAGGVIRESLLKKLKKLVKEGVSIDDSLKLTLPGVDAGELSVLRVSAVDPVTTEVPYHQVGVVLSLFD